MTENNHPAGTTLAVTIEPTKGGIVVRTPNMQTVVREPVDLRSFEQFGEEVVERVAEMCRESGITVAQ